MITDSKTPRREFLGKLAAAGTIPALLSSLNAEAAGTAMAPWADADEWFKKVKGKHKIVFDATEPNGGFAVIWSWVYYKTNNATGSPDNDLTAVVVMRHGAIPLALEDKVWEKYKLGEVFKINDGTTNAPALRNPYNTPTDPLMASMGMDGIKGLTARGAMFCVCDVALTVYSGAVAKSINGNAEEIKKEWLAGLLPGVQIVPSGVWAVGRAQEKGCAYAYAGG
jgi:intracellular sulfur oxidation DsrE/DsrF family protein